MRRKLQAAGFGDMTMNASSVTHASKVRDHGDFEATFGDADGPETLRRLQAAGLHP